MSSIELTLLLRCSIYEMFAQLLTVDDIYNDIHNNPSAAPIFPKCTKAVRSASILECKFAVKLGIFFVDLVIWLLSWIVCSLCYHQNI